MSELERAITKTLCDAYRAWKLSTGRKLPNLEALCDDFAIPAKGVL